MMYLCSCIALSLVTYKSNKIPAEGRLSFVRKHRMGRGSNSTVLTPVPLNSPLLHLLGWLLWPRWQPGGAGSLLMLRWKPAGLPLSSFHSRLRWMWNAPRSSEQPDLQCVQLVGHQTGNPSYSQPTCHWAMYPLMWRNWHILCDMISCPNPSTQVPHGPRERNDPNSSMWISSQTPSHLRC